MDVKTCRHCGNSFQGNNSLCSVCFNSLSAEQIDDYNSLGFTEFLAFIFWLFVIFNLIESCN